MKVPAFIKQNQKALIIIFKLIVFSLLVYNIYQKLAEKGFKEALENFKREFNFSYLWYLIPVFILMFINWGLEAWKWWIATKYIEDISYWQAYKAIFIGTAINQILPIGAGEVAGRSLMHSAGKKWKAAAMTYFSQMPQKTVTMLIGVGFLIFVLNENWLEGQFMHWLIWIGIVDSIIWYIPFFHAKTIIPWIRKISFLEKMAVYLQEIEDFRIQDKWKIYAISALRWGVFTLQYVIVSYIFFNDINFYYYFSLCAVNFLLQSVIPSAGFLDLGIRGNLAFMAFAPLMHNQVGILSVSYLIWIINLLIPSAIGYFFLLKMKQV